MQPSPVGHSSVPAAPAWVFLFSHVTSEALLLESLAILFLILVYSAFWVVKKRRYGAAGPEIPASAIKNYINTLIVDAEQLRTQFFGIISRPQQTKIPDSQQGGRQTGFTKDSHLFNTLKQHLSEQAQTIEKMKEEKAIVEKDLQDAKSSLQEMEDIKQRIAAQNAEFIRMEQKTQDLEEKLSEYSVIEDDLANLKRFQQENVALKNALSEAGLPIPEITITSKPEETPSSPAPSPSSPDADSEQSAAAEKKAPSENPTATLTSIPNPEGPSQAASPSPSSSLDEGLPIEASLAPEPPLKTDEEGLDPSKKEEDLVKEFEKMLQE